ncbi:ribokinase [Brevibacillus borstelensis]|uniref:ribokinase n=1 Tax=Brevibacillus borstelensis TaxID=45462 RepID=UPI002042090E|nr:ribokinase [Brevibacillus borstelensis]MCM3622968.1 ribokinase [Brevibacillus borstelensis]
METQGQKHIVVIGSYNVGFICSTPRMPVWGETILGSGFSVCDGGKGSNQSVAAAKLGGSVSFIGCVGDDPYGKSGVAMLREAGVNVDEVSFSQAAPTGVGFVFLNQHGENCIVVDPGANHLLLPEELETKASIRRADILVFQLENHLDTIRKGMELGRKWGKTVILNPAPATPDLDDLLALSSIVTPNESELLILHGLDPAAELTDAECERLARLLLEKGPEAVIVTRGEKGAMAVTADEVASIPAPKVTVADTTGAGDSFTGALAVALSEGKSLAEAVRFACCVGAYCVTKEDVIPALPTREQLNDFIKTFE